MGILKVIDFELLMYTLREKVGMYNHIREDHVRIWAKKSIIDLMLLEEQRHTGKVVKYCEGQTTLFGAKLLPSPTENIIIGLLEGDCHVLPFENYFNRQKPILA